MHQGEGSGSWSESLSLIRRLPLPIGLPALGVRRAGFEPALVTNGVKMKMIFSFS